MDIESVSKKPVVSASESVGERLVHGPGGGIVKQDRDDQAVEEPNLQMIRYSCRFPDAV